jgi:hypothetical protein
MELDRAVKIWIVVFRIMTSCSLVGGYRREDGGNVFFQDDGNHLESHVTRRRGLEDDDAIYLNVCTKSVLVFVS